MVSIWVWSPYMVSIWVWHMDGVCREPWASKAGESTPCPEITIDPPLGQGWCTYYTMPSKPHESTTHLASVPWLVRGQGSVHSIIWTLTNDLQESSTHMETQGVIGVPPHPLGAPQVYYLENKGPPPCQRHFEDFIHHYGTFGYYRAFWRAPRHSHIIIWSHPDFRHSFPASIFGIHIHTWGERSLF